MDNKTSSNIDIAYYRAEKKLCVICGTKIIGSRIDIIGLKKTDNEKIALPFHKKCYEDDWPKTF